MENKHEEPGKCPECGKPVYEGKTVAASPTEIPIIARKFLDLSIHNR